MSKMRLKMNEGGVCRAVRAPCENNLAFPQTVNLESPRDPAIPKELIFFKKHSNMNVNRIPFLTGKKWQKAIPSINW